MCGLLSLYLSKDHKNFHSRQELINRLFVLSQSRGVDATGATIHDINRNIVELYKEPLRASDFIKTKDFQRACAKLTSSFALMGHIRLATNGSNAYTENNQPISNNKIACVQNGIVTNLEQITGLSDKEYELDTYAMMHIFESALEQSKDIWSATRDLFSKIEGENTLILHLFEQNKLLHATNSGTLYYINDINNGLFVSCSEMHIMNLFKTEFKIEAPILHLKPGQVMVLDYIKLKIELREIEQKSIEKIEKLHEINKNGFKFIDLEEKFYKDLVELKRCTKCILPETFPGISFDDHGVCNICKKYLLLKNKPIQDLEEILDKYRSKNSSPDCLVAFSGGRDSSYGLHLIKNKYKMNPVAYSYDWGMVTDLARRNQARLCGKLGIEHIWVSADIRFKRKSIRSNLEAWIKNPHIGMVPLFMVGDKTYFYHANRVMKNMGLKLIIFCPNNLERTNFKASYCGITEKDFGQQVHQLSLGGKLKLLKFYATQYLKNPRYINGSIFDVMAGFLSYYVMNQDFLYLFDYEKWDEEEIDELLKTEYGWEWDPKYPSSWRIGDGSAPLYNMIYYMYAGFTENDCFRSNQIREGVISREEALKRVNRENIPRLCEVEEYCKLISVNFVELINAIRRIKYDAN